MAVTIPAFGSDTKQKDIPAFDASAIPPMEEAAPAPAPAPIKDNVPSFDARGDQSPVEGLWDSVVNFLPNVRDSVVSALTGFGAQQARRVQEQPSDFTSPLNKTTFDQIVGHAFPPFMALDGLRRIAKNFAPEDAFAHAESVLNAMRQEEQLAIADRTQGSTSLAAKAVDTAAQSIGMMAPSVAIAPFAGTPGVLASMGLLTAADSENRALDTGVPLERAKLYGKIDGLVEAGTEALPVGEAMKLGGPFMTKLARFFAKEVPSELLATLLQDTNAQIVAHPETPIPEFVQNLKEDLLLTLASTPLSGAIQAGALHSGAKAAQAIDILREQRAARAARNGIIERKLNEGEQQDTGIAIDEFMKEIERQLQIPQEGQEVRTIKQSPSEWFASQGTDFYQHFDTNDLAKKTQGMTADQATEFLKQYSSTVKLEPDAQAELNGFIESIAQADKGQQIIVPADGKIMYHGTPHEFTEFEKRIPIEIGFHFANEPSTAEDRALKRAMAAGKQPKSVRVIMAYLNMQNPLVIPDMGTSPTNIANWIAAKFGPTDATAKDFGKKVSLAMMNAAVGKQQDIKAFNAGSKMVVGWLESHGYDGLKYKNEVEKPMANYSESNTPPEGKWSYMVLRPQQIVQLGQTEDFHKITKEYAAALWDQKKALLMSAKANANELFMHDPTQQSNKVVAAVAKNAESETGPIPYNVLGGVNALTPKEIATLAQAKAGQGGNNFSISSSEEGWDEKAHELLQKAHKAGKELYVQTDMGTLPVVGVPGDNEIVVKHPGGVEQSYEPFQLTGKYVLDFHMGDVSSEFGIPELQNEQGDVGKQLVHEVLAELGLQDLEDPVQKDTNFDPQEPLNEPTPVELKQKLNEESDLEHRRRLTKMDRFNKFIKLSAGLEWIAKMNPHIGGLQDYLHATRDWWRTKSVWTTRADKFLGNEWNKAIRQKDINHFDQYMVEADKRSTELGRLLKPNELAQIVQDLKLQLPQKAVDFADKVWAEYRAVLDAVEQQVVAEAKRTIADPIRQRRAILEYQRVFNDMRNRNYVPHSRFGKYAVLVKAKVDGIKFDGRTFNAGDTVLFATFESKKARKEGLKKALSMFNESQAKVIGDYIIDDTVQMFQGLPAPVAQMISSRLGLSVKQQEQLAELQHELSPGARFAKHFNNRSDVPGYAPDMRRVFADYFLRFSNHIARITHNYELQNGIQEVKDSLQTDFQYGEDRTKRRQIQEWLQNHYDYLNNPGNELANLRALGFLWYLGFSPKSALINLTQVPFVAFPHLAARYGDVASIAALTKATAKAASSIKGTQVLTANEQAMLDELRQRGILDQSSATELGAVSEGSQIQRLTAGRFVGNERAAQSIRQVAQWAGWMFQTAEKFNRNVVALSTYDLAMKNGMTHSQAIDIAHEAIIDTQFEYARYNRPEMMRGKKAALFLFWQYMSNMLYFIGSDPGRWRYLAMMLLAAGISGLPGMENAMDVFDYFATKIKEKTGWKDPKVSARLELRDLIQTLNETPYVNWLVPNNPNLAMHGLSSNLGGFDVSGSLSMGRLIPGTEALSTEMDPDKAVSQSLQNVSGALGNVAFTIYHALGSNEPGTWRQAERMMPTVVKNAMRAYRYASTGKETDASGATVAEFDPTNWNDRILIGGQALGFPVAEVNRKREEQFLARDVVNYYNARRTVLFADYAWALQQTPEEVNAVRDAIAKYNDSVPHPVLKITGQDLARAIRTRQMNQGMKENVAPVPKRQVPFYREIEERFVPDPALQDTGANPPESADGGAAPDGG